jgi:protein SCO1/2
MPTAAAPRAAACGPQRAWIGFCFAGLLWACTAAGVTAAAQGNDVDAAALRASQAVIGQRTSGDLKLLDQRGRPLELAQLRGRPLLLNLIFTNCQSICSGLTLQLREVVKVGRDTLGPRSFAVLTVGFDTQHDTPERMRVYARERGIDDPDWYFASGDAATIQRLTDQVGFTWVESPAGFDHVAQVTVLDADGTVVQQVYGPEFQPPDLVEPLKSLLLGRSVERPSVRSLIERVRLSCSTYDPASGRYRFDYSVFAAAIPPLMVLGMAAIAIVLAARRRR